MTGGFSLREKNGYYHAVVSYKDSTGKYRTKSMSTRIPAVKGNRRRAETKGRELVAQWLQREAESQKKEKNIMLSDAITAYIDARQGVVQPNTLAEYRRLGKLLLATAGDTPINEINDDVISGIKDKLKGKNDTGNTIRHYLVLLNSVLKFAERQGYELHSPGFRAEYAKPPKYSASWYTVDEVKALLRAADNSPIRCAVYLAAYLGLRRSEVLGLKWENVDLKNKIVKICQKRVYFSNNGKVIIEQSDKMKTTSSDRILPLPDALCAVLDTDTDKVSYVVKNTISKPMNPCVLTNSFRNLLKRNGFRKIRFHDLRHTCASLLLQSGADMKTVQTILGHGSYTITADIYSHVDLQGKRKAIDKFERNLL